MVDKASVKFGQQYKAYRKACDQHPQFFFMACEIMRRRHEDSVILMHALMDGLREAYEAGRAGKPLPSSTTAPVDSELQAIANKSLAISTMATSGLMRTDAMMPPKRVVRRAR